ncbi:Nuclear cap-binding protein subunit 1 [Borealophlyctis nickersoniae]|nr:Nuclear cap-binding protein subunit 1 [Borealophlyctis nickersoniae]
MTQLPQKASFYGTLTGIVNARNFKTGGAFVRAACDILQQAVNANEFRTVKITLRYIAELVNANVIRPAQLIGLFDVFLTVLSEPNVPVRRADAFVYVLLATIPWVGSQLRDRTPSELDRVLATVEGYMNSRKQNAPVGIAQALEALKTYRDGEPYNQGDRLELLWAQILHLKKADDWEAKVLFKTHSMFEETLGQNLQHELLPVTIPNRHDVKFSYQPKFWVFDDSVHSPENAIIKLPPVFSISRFILDDVAYDIIRIFSLNHKEACRMLRDLETYLNKDYLYDNHYNYMASVTETLFGELFRLPRSQEKSMYYATLLVDLVKEDPKSFPKVLGRAIKILFERLDGSGNLGGGMDVECVRRFAEWFAVHLSNFGYAWKWQDWESTLEMDPGSAKAVFIKETLEKCIRLSYYERICGTVPESFVGKLLPDAAPSPNFKYDTVQGTGDQKLHELVTRLQTQLGQKSDPAVISDTLTRIRNYAAGIPIMDGLEANGNDDADMGTGVVLGDPERIAREAFIQCLMQHGSKSFSHILNAIERYTGLLRDFNTDDGGRSHTVQIIADFWSSNTQFLEIVLGKLMNYRVLDPRSILGWLLSQNVMDKHFNRFFVWSALRATLNKVLFKVEQIKIKVDAAEKAEANGDTEMTDHSNELENLRLALENAGRERKEAFLGVFQKFVDVIHSKSKAMEAEGIDPTTTAWWRWVVGNMREVARGFPSEVHSLQVTLNIIVFDTADSRIVKLWEEVGWVYELHTDYLA